MNHTASRLKFTYLSLFVGLFFWGLNGLPNAMAQIVNCDDPTQNLSDAIQSANPGDTIQFSGMCSETITITTDRLTLDGQGAGIIDGGGAGSTDVLNVDGARDVLLTGLTVQNGVDGIAIIRGASAVVRDVISQNHVDDGIAATDNATLRLEGAILSQNNQDDGITITFSSSLSIAEGSTVEVLNNGDDGLQVFASSALRISATIQANGNGMVDAFGDGIQVSGTSTAFVSSSANITASQNASRGIVLANTSYFLISPPSTTTLSRNGRDGLGVFTLSRLNLSSSSELRSESNAGSGILVSSTSIVSCSTASTVVLDGNASPFTVSGSSLSEACQGMMPATQGMAPQPAVDEVPNGETFGD